MKKRILDVCIYGICTVVAILWSVYVLQSMTIDLSTTTFSNTYAYILMNVFDLTVSLFITYTFLKSLVSFIKYLRKEWAEGANERKEKREQSDFKRKQQQIAELQAKIDELKK